MKKGFVILVLSLAVLLVLYNVSAASFETNNVLLKVSLQKGAETTRVISVSSDTGGEFKIDTHDLRGVKVSNIDFVLGASEKGQVDVTFDSKSLEPGVYVGTITITGGKDISNIPVIFEVESASVFFDVNVDIPPQYNEVEPGGKLIAQVKIFDLTSGGTSDGLGATNVDMEYYLYGLDGQTLSSETESVVVNKQVSTTKPLTLPSDMKEGDYVFVAVVNYKGSVGVSTQLFAVAKKRFSLFDFGGGGVNYGFISILGAFLFVFVVIIFLFVYMIRDRDKMLIELKKYNISELRSQKNFLLAQEKILTGRKGVSKKEVRVEIKQKVVSLKKKQAQRWKEFKKLKKAGNRTEMMRKLNSWKREGYNTVGIESKLKGLSVSDMKSIIGKWKREGYNISKKPKVITHRHRELDGKKVGRSQSPMRHREAWKNKPKSIKR